MSKIPIWMDLISGLLLAIDFYPKHGIAKKVDTWVRDKLTATDTNDPTNGRTVVFNFLVSSFIFSMLLVWAFYKNSSQPDNNVGIEILLFGIGSVISCVLITTLTVLLMKISRKFLKGSLEVSAVVLLVGTLLSALALINVPRLHPPVEVIVSLIAFVFMCILLPFAMLIANNIKKALSADKDKPFYVFAFMGLVMFVAGKIIELTV